jgi:hypothetical protein
MDEETDPLAPPFATKVAIVIRDDLEPWQGLNVTAFLVSGITAAHPELVGAPYEDADGQQYLEELVLRGALVLPGLGQELADERLVRPAEVDLDAGQPSAPEELPA